MAVQVDYPGIYIEEFAPGAPIEGVSTSVASFTGVAAKGPIEQPTLIQSWDAFVEIFGGFIATPPTGFLAAAVYGFFLNGGRSCYVTRAGTGTQSSIGLDSRTGGVGPPPVLIAKAIGEGPAGDKISVQVTDASVLASMLAAAGLPGTTLAPAFASTNIVSLNAARDTLVLGSNAGFAVNDRIHLRRAANNATAVVKAVQGPDTLILTAPVPGAANFNTGVCFLEGMVKGRKVFRLQVDPKISLAQALPQGTALRITQAAKTEVATVESSGGDTVTLVQGLANDYDTSVAGPPLPTIATLEFDLAITDSGTGANESFKLLATNPRHPNYWGSTVVSSLITLTEAVPPPAVEDFRPVAALYNLAGGIDDNRATAWADVQANPNDYLDLLKPIDEISIVAIPGATGAIAQQAVRDHCEIMADRFGILDGVQDATSGFTNLKLQFSNVRSERGFVALYYPWIVVPNTLTKKNESIPPSGHLAGIYARTDQSRGVHKAPANTNVRGAIGLDRRLSDAQQGPLNILGIDVLRVFPTSGQPIVWGARTTATDRNWQYINVRRLFLYLEESIEEGIRWAIFEPNNTALWKKLKRTLTEFLTRVWRDGALFGEKAEEAFYVRIDEVLNPPSTQALGRLYIEIGVRPTYPAEFIVVRIGIWQGGSEVIEG
jgi:hypothetical protein